MKKKILQTIQTSICIFMGFTMTSFKDLKEFEKLKEVDQTQILQQWDNLDLSEKNDLLNQINQLDLDTFKAQRESILHPIEDTDQVISPFNDYTLFGSEKDLDNGKKLMCEGKVGCLIVAGGQGSRLGYEGPKGLYPVTVIRKKSLFQLFAEKVLAASRQVNQKLLLAIMTSSVNHAETVKYFQENKYFGLDQDQISFFSQSDLPFLDKDGNLFLETPSKIAAGPDGNAASLKHFVDQNIWSDWYEKGVRYLNYVHIDNALADPFDAELIGFHDHNPVDLVIKCVTRQDPLEKVGVILKNHNKVQVIEYSEITDVERLARDEQGNLRHLCANISMFSFKMDFVKKIADRYFVQFPFHKAWKAVKYLSEDGTVKMSAQPQAWKFEKFIFDLLPYADSVKALLYPRENCFAPLKNASGADSVVDVKQALQRFDRAIIKQLTGYEVSEDLSFELDPQLYYPLKSEYKNLENKVKEGAYIQG